VSSIIAHKTDEGADLCKVPWSTAFTFSRSVRMSSAKIMLPRNFIRSWNREHFNGLSFRLASFRRLNTSFRRWRSPWEHNQIVDVDQTYLPRKTYQSQVDQTLERRWTSMEHCTGQTEGHWNRRSPCELRSMFYPRPRPWPSLANTSFAYQDRKTEYFHPTNHEKDRCAATDSSPFEWLHWVHGNRCSSNTF